MKGCHYNLIGHLSGNQQIMCIVMLDNRRLVIGGFVKKRRKLNVSLLCLGLVLYASVGSGCRDRSAQSSEEETATSEKSTSERITEADALYGQRKDLSNVRRGIIALRQARIRDPGNYETAWKLARLEYFLGTHAKDDGEREAAFRDGIEAGKTAVQLQDNQPDGHFWLGANYGGSAEMSVLASLSSFQDIRSQMEKVIELDGSYESGSAYLGLGTLYLKAPKILGGDTKKAVEYLEKGLRFGSNNALLHLRLAEGYHALGHDQDAQKQIDFILKMTPDADHVPEYDDAVMGAKQLEKRIQL
jgi:tetratricopeptide (TPR) repeat protein